MRRVMAGAAAFAAMLGAPATAGATITGVLGGATVSGSALSCAAQSDGVRVCHGDFSSSGGPDQRLRSFDGVPLEVYVTLPPAPSSGSDGPYPLIVQSHGWGSSAKGPSNGEYGGPTGDTLAKAGYAVLQLTARGFNDSCGDAPSRLADPAGCAAGYIRLDDIRYEARDVQYATGLLVDEGIADPARIGVTGESYGGGVSLELASLKDRIVNADGSTSAWTSPHGTPLQIAAAAPVVPWSDLVYSLLPNGRTAVGSLASPTTDTAPVGVDKQSFVAGLYAVGNTTGYYAPPSTNSQADLTSWFAQINAGEPYDTNPSTAAIVAQIAQFHSPYYLLDGAYQASSEQPAPLLIANGFTDDLFPVDEAVRYADLVHSLYPNAPLSLFDGDFGHQRAQNKKDVGAALSAAIRTFLDHYLRGSGPQPASDATAYTETCPASAPSGGPFTASSFEALAAGAVTYSTATAQSVVSSAGDPTIGRTVDPIGGRGACATVSARDQGPGVATYRLPAAAGTGYTLLGAMTIGANLTVTGTFPELAARLWDVDPATNTETLVARGVYRFAGQTSGVVTFQLHPGGWHFAAGHIPKLELLGQDAPYARASNGTFSIAVNSLGLSLPVHDAPGSSPGVTPPGPVSIPTPAHPSPVCRTRPASKIAKARTKARRHHVFVTGTTSEPACPGTSASAAAAHQVARVWVAIYRTAPGGRCRFVVGSGRLLRPRPCARPRQYRARGTRRWTLARRLRLRPGWYLIRADAVDGARVHQRHSGASVQLVHVR